ncbi:hypothetical protein [Microcoleus sp. herbarium2]
MGLTQIFWGEFAGFVAIRARYAVYSDCKFVPDCSAIGVPALANIG